MVGFQYLFSSTYWTWRRSPIRKCLNHVEPQPIRPMRPGRPGRASRGVLLFPKLLNARCHLGCGWRMRTSGVEFLAVRKALAYTKPCALNCASDCSWAPVRPISKGKSVCNGLIMRFHESYTSQKKIRMFVLTCLRDRGIVVLRPSGNTSDLSSQWDQGELSHWLIFVSWAEVKICSASWCHHSWSRQSLPYTSWGKDQTCQWSTPFPRLPVSSGMRVEKFGYPKELLQSQSTNSAAMRVSSGTFECPFLGKCR